MSGITPTQRKVYARTLVVWLLLGIGIYFVMILDPRQDSDLYVNAWTFRSAMFLIFLLPAWTAFLGFVLLLEAGYFKCKEGR